MSHPLIGITSNSYHTSTNDTTNSLSYAYTTAVRNAGGLPLLIPNEFPPDHLDDLLARLGGLIISGGSDIQSSRLNRIETEPEEEVKSDRDELEIRLVQKALETDLPLIGICRGIQVINVALGGTLITDIPSEFPTQIRHNNPSSRYPRNLIAHTVTLEPDSFLASILGQTQVNVNSRHHQAVKDPAAGVRISAHSPDGLIEGLEIPARRFAVGVQWHPENLQSIAEDRAFFSAFVRAAQV